MMRGLTPDELSKVMTFVKEHHRFGYVPKESRLKSDQYMWIKYVDVCWDTRTETFWAITFRTGSTGACFTSNHFNAINPPPKDWPYKNLYDLCMAYLEYKFEPPKKFWVDEKTPLPPKPVLAALSLDQAMNGVWIVRNKFAKGVQDFGEGDAGKLLALQYIYDNQTYDQ